ncbi:MAG: PBP1A family penicillin-binding protein [Desulfobulbaceae bacterium]|nr:PBP1A family penicillin-binding protein [Desulfobulbaceae bacterium]
MKKKPKTKPRQIRIHWNHNHLGILILCTGLAITCFIGFLLFLFVALNIPDIDTLRNYRPNETSIIKDRYGKIVDRIYVENRIVVPMDDMPHLLSKAFIAAEDARFHDHRGVDAISILRALINNIRAGGRSQGGSTITQQVARSLLLTREKTYIRKLKEAILAYRIDQALTKEEILHIYLNQIYLGEKSYGVEAAAQTYFGKPVQKLSLAEMAILAGLPQAPSRYSPFSHYAKAKKRQGYVLNRMAAEGFITATTAQKAFSEPLHWAPRKKYFTHARYFLAHVRKKIRRQYGDHLLSTGGLTIETTLDLNLQKQASQSVEKGLASWALRSGKGKTTPPQTALVSIENGTGYVRALIGGVNFQRSQFNRATQAKRQPGSAFKPLIFAQAFNSVFTPASIIMDEPLELPGHKESMWQPQNFSGENYGPTTLFTALVKSRNIVTIKLLQSVGIDSILHLARQVGIGTKLHSNLSLALGASEVSLLELTSAYTVFANAGNFNPPIFITKVYDRDSRVLEHNIPRQIKVLDARAAYQVTRLLQDVIREGTGKKAGGLPGHSAGKTGTTDGNMDAWFIGYTPQIVTGVWMGFDLKKSLGKQETGGLACGPVWFDFMSKATAGVGPKFFKTPKGITFLPIDKKTGHYNPSIRNKDQWLPFRAENIDELLRGNNSSSVN